MLIMRNLNLISVQSWTYLDSMKRNTKFYLISFVVLNINYKIAYCEDANFSLSICVSKVLKLLQLGQNKNITRCKFRFFNFYSS